MDIKDIIVKIVMIGDYYEYNYTPLFSDLIKYMPLFDIHFLKNNQNYQFSKCSISICFVKDYHFLIKESLRKKLETE